MRARHVAGIEEALAHTLNGHLGIELCRVVMRLYGIYAIARGRVHTFHG